MKFILLVILLCITGCGTVESLRDSGRTKDEHCSCIAIGPSPSKGSPVYSGIKWHFAEDSRPKILTTCVPSPVPCINRCWLNVVDLPLSAVADTVLLPYTLFAD